jgi:MSHA pilin protein MshD
VAVSFIHRGFTLIELIVGMVVFSATMVTVITLVVNQTRQSIDPILQTRAANLAQSLADEILSKAYDEQSNLEGGTIRCGEQGTTCSVVLGPDGVGSNRETREQYDDVDDYHNLLINSGGSIQSALGDIARSGSAQLYQGFLVDVAVQYDNQLGVEGKRITISVTTSANQRLIFSFFRMNY